jgi:hypothetical protein
LSRVPRRAAAGLALAASLAAGRAGAASGAALDYTLHCEGCHRADGAGTPGSVPPLAGSVGRLARAPGGREFLARVPGVATSPLDDAALAAVLNWMLARFGGADVPADFVPYTADEVARLRRQPLVDVERAKQQILEATGTKRR